MRRRTLSALGLEPSTEKHINSKGWRTRRPSTRWPLQSVTPTTSARGMRKLARATVMSHCSTGPRVPRVRELSADEATAINIEPAAKHAEAIHLGRTATPKGGPRGLTDRCQPKNAPNEPVNAHGSKRSDQGCCLQAINLSATIPPNPPSSFCGGAGIRRPPAGALLPIPAKRHKELRWTPEKSGSPAQVPCGGAGNRTRVQRYKSEHSPGAVALWCIQPGGFVRPIRQHGLHHCLESLTPP